MSLGLKIIYLFKFFREMWLSGLKRWFAKSIYVINVAWVRILSSPSVRVSEKVTQLVECWFVMSMAAGSNPVFFADIKLIEFIFNFLNKHK